MYTFQRISISTLTMHGTNRLFLLYLTSDSTEEFVYFNTSLYLNGCLLSVPTTKSIAKVLTRNSDHCTARINHEWVLFQP